MIKNVNNTIKKIILLILVPALILSAGGCGLSKSSNNTQEETDVSIINKSKKMPELSTSFSQSDEVFKNPLMGWAPSADSDDAVADNSLVYIDITWREFEPQKGVYDFETLVAENQIEQWKEEGKHAVLRFLCDKPSSTAHRDIPDWLYEETQGDGTDYSTSYGNGYSPNYNNTTFIECHAQAIKALGEYFSTDTFVSFVELGSLGHWGEWHVKYEDGLDRIPSEAVRLEYITPYVEYFTNAKFLMRRPFNAAKTYGFGLFDDMAGSPEGTEEWLEWIANGGDYSQANERDALSAMPNQWKIAPIGGEFNSDYSMDWMLRTNLEETVSLLKRSHTTFLGPKSPTGDKVENGINSTEGIETILKTIGYRFYIEKVEIANTLIKNNLKITLTWNNAGVAPMYFDWPVYLYYADANNNILGSVKVDLQTTKLLPNTQIKTTTEIADSSIPDGTVKLFVGIVDPMTSLPSVKLAMDANRLGNLSIIADWTDKWTD